MASARSACLRAAPESARKAKTVAVITSADAATMSMWFASARPAASAATSSASSQRPVSMYAHPSTVRLPPLVPRTPGARSRCMASCSQVIARSDSSRSHAVEAIRHKEGSSIGEPTILRRYGRSWFLLPIGSALARIHSFSALTSTCRGPAGGRRVLAFQQAEGAAYGLVAGGHAGLVGDSGCTPERVPGQGRRSRDASSATEMSADRAAVRRPDQASAHPASWRAVSRSPGPL